jgi:hypothetical protein
VATFRGAACVGQGRQAGAQLIAILSC